MAQGSEATSIKCHCCNIGLEGMFERWSTQPPISVQCIPALIPIRSSGWYAYRKGSLEDAPDTCWDIIAEHTMMRGRLRFDVVNSCDNETVAPLSECTASAPRSSESLNSGSSISEAMDAVRVQY